MESDSKTWNIDCENTPNIPEVIISANVTLGPRRVLRLYLLNGLRNKKIGTVIN